MFGKSVFRSVLVCLSVLAAGAAGAQTTGNDAAGLVSAAQSGDADAQYRMGVAYENTDGGRKSLSPAARRGAAEAAKWYRAAAAQGHVLAQYSLGEIYENGTVVAQDMAEAVKLYRSAALAGHAGAQTKMGDVYAVHSGVVSTEPKSDVEAAKWYRMASAQGNDGAEFSLGVLYEMGEGMPHDPAEAMRLFRSSAAKGNGDALSLIRIRSNNIRIMRP